WAQRAHMLRTENDLANFACWVALDAINHLFPDAAGDDIGASLMKEWEELARRFSLANGLEGTSLFSHDRAEVHLALSVALENCRRSEPLISSESRDLHGLLDEILSHSSSDQNGEVW